MRNENQKTFGIETPANVTRRASRFPAHGRIAVHVAESGCHYSDRPRVATRSNLIETKQANHATRFYAADAWGKLWE